MNMIATTTIHCTPLAVPAPMAMALDTLEDQQRWYHRGVRGHVETGTMKIRANECAGELDTRGPWSLGPAHGVDLDALTPAQRDMLAIALVETSST